MILNQTDLWKVLSSGPVVRGCKTCKFHANGGCNEPEFLALGGIRPTCHANYERWEWNGKS